MSRSYHLSARCFLRPLVAPRLRLTSGLALWPAHPSLATLLTASPPSGLRPAERME